MALGHMLGDEGPGARHLAADGRALQHAEEEQQQRRGDADAGIGRQEADAERRKGHQEDAEGEDALAAQHVAEMREQNAAERPRQIARREDAEGLELAQPVRHAGREEQLAQHRDEEHEDDEIVEFERPAERRQRQSAVVPTTERSGGGKGGIGHGRGNSVGRDGRCS